MTNKSHRIYWTIACRLLEHFEKNEDGHRTYIGEPRLSYWVPGDFRQRRPEPGASFPELPEGAYGLLFEGLELLFFGKVWVYDELIGWYQSCEAREHPMADRLAPLSQYKRAGMPPEALLDDTWYEDPEHYDFFRRAEKQSA